jgi:hypothetical protein
MAQSRSNGGWRSHVVSTGAPALWQTGTFSMVFPTYRKLNPQRYDDTLSISAAWASWVGRA